MDKPVEIPLIVYDNLERIRKEGTDMKDYQAVITAAELSGDRVTVDWLHNNMKIYIQGVKFGLMPEGVTSESCRVQSLAGK